MVTTRLLLVSALVVVAPLSAFAASEATVGVKIAELRIKPDDQAFSRLKIPGGREVAVLGKSDDGRWIKVRTEIEKGEDVIKLEGWLEATQLKGADTESLSVAAGGSSSRSSDTGFGESSAPSDSDWGDTAKPASSSEPAASSTEAWDATPATAPAESSSDSMGSWDLPSDSDSSSSESAPAPKSDEWESTGDGSSASDSGASSDGW